MQFRQERGKSFPQILFYGFCGTLQQFGELCFLRVDNHQGLRIIYACFVSFLNPVKKIICLPERYFNNSSSIAGLSIIPSVVYSSSHHGLYLYSNSSISTVYLYDTIVQFVKKLYDNDFINVKRKIKRSFYFKK